MNNYIRLLLLALLFVAAGAQDTIAQAQQNSGHVAVAPMDMMILPGTGAYLQSAIETAHAEGAKLLIITLDTPGGLLQTSQDMVQAILNAPLPVVVYVHPSGGTATSAGVFITLAAHIAAMAPGTSIGAAHPVTGEGKDIEGDMRAKAENMTIAMVRAISDQRGRNTEWAEKSVRESNSITEQEALKIGVIDVVAADIPDLLKQLEGKTVPVQGADVELGDYSSLPVKDIPMSFRDQAINVLANPSIAALLWLGATTGITLELYNPGAVFPGVVGVICLVLALLVSSVIPISSGGLVLLILGAILLALEVYVGSGILGVGGLVALTLGAVYLIDLDLAPGMAVSLEIIIPFVLVMAGLLFYVASQVGKTFSKALATGAEGLVGDRGTAAENIATTGRIFVNGEYWRAEKSDSQAGVIDKGAEVVVESVRDGLVLVVRKIDTETGL